MKLHEWTAKQKEDEAKHIRHRAILDALDSMNASWMQGHITDEMIKSTLHPKTIALDIVRECL